MTGFDVSGVLRALEQFEQRATSAVEGALVDSVTAMRADSDGRVPIFMGDVLTSSTGKVDLDLLLGGSGYDHASAPALHENPRGRRYKHGRTEKFLETAHNAAGASLPGEVADAVRQVMS